MSNPTLAAAVAPVADYLVTNGSIAHGNNFQWYAIKMQDATHAEVNIYDEIGGWGVTAKQFVGDLKAITASHITLRINSPGGEVFDATAIYNAIREHPAHVTTYIDGLAASAASVIALAGNQVNIADNAYMMIHNASVGVFGGADDMKKYADLLDKLNVTIAETYQKKGGNKLAHWQNLMAAETWFTAQEAVDAGLADAVYTAAQPEPKTAKATHAFRAYNKVPEAVRKLYTNQAPEPFPRGDVTPLAVPQQEPIMATENVTAPAPPPAAPPAAPLSTEQQIAAYQGQTAKSHRDAGYADGLNDGRRIAGELLKAIVAVCPGKPQMAIDAFDSGQTPEAVKLAYDAALVEKQAADEVNAALRLKVARLEALATAGGHAGVAMALNASAASEITSGMEPKQQAEWEWDHLADARKTARSKDIYVIARTAELNGTHRSFSMTGNN